MHYTKAHFHDVNFYALFPFFPLSRLRSSDQSESQMTDFFVGLELVDACCSCSWCCVGVFGF
jgi:hypothetical protein